MGRISDFKMAHNEIVNFFEGSEIKSFSEISLQGIFDLKRDDWKIRPSKSITHFIDFIRKEKILVDYNLTGNKGHIKSIYLFGPYDDFTLFSGIKQQSYYTHYSAMYLNQLTLQIPKTVYLNKEHYSQTPFTGFTQKAIDNAFSKEQRKSSNYFAYKSKRVYLLNGRNSNRLGVIHKLNDSQSYYYTNIERTLIDIAVRPVYAGGVFEVLNAFKNAINIVDPHKLKSYLNQLMYHYPYEKSIGFYMEKAGFNEDILQLYEIENPYRFYLTYNIQRKKYSKRWNLYYPEGL